MSSPEDKEPQRESEGLNDFLRETTLGHGEQQPLVQAGAAAKPSNQKTVRFETVLAKTIAVFGDLEKLSPSDTIRATGQSPEERDSFFWADEGEEPIEIPEHAPTILVSEFKMLNVIGKGGMGVVFRALQPNLGREVAVKTMRSELKRRPELQNAFICEAIVTALLNHPNIVPVHSMATSKEGLVSFSMKLVGGKPWSSLIHNKSDSDSPTLLGRHIEILRAVSHAVDFAHDKGILHRDLKPDNVMVGSFGEVLVMDWGLACGFGDRGATAADILSQRSQHARDIDHIAGTPSYLAPEMALAMGSEFGPWTDVYLLGGLLHEILVKRPPHQGPSIHVILASAAASVPPTFPDLIPSGLQKICQKALSSNPGDRYQSVNEFLAALDEYEGHHESEELATMARADVTRGREAKRGKRAYGFYNQAIAGFRQALAVWPQNAEAAKDLAVVHRCIAEIALERGDLGIAQINIEELEDKENLLELVQTKEDDRGEEKKAKRRQKVVLIATVAIVVVSLLVEYILVSIQHTKAEKERAEKQQALDDFERMSDIKQLASARSDAALLWPPSKNIVEGLESWLDRYRPLFERLEVHEATLLKIREFARPYDQDQRAADYQSEYAELKRLKARRGALVATSQGAMLKEFDQRIQKVEQAVQKRKSWDFGEDIDKSFMQETLSRLVEDLTLESGNSGLLQSIKSRIQLAIEIESATVGRFATAWEETLTGVRASSNYEVNVTPVVGLIPLGKNPKTGLFEFLHWLSHKRGAPLPVRNSAGDFKVMAETGVILVLLPGSSFHMGSIHPYKAALSDVNIDIHAAKDELPVHEVKLSPFLIGKYEVTQGQWQRLFGANPSFHLAGTKVKETLIDATHPVEQVDWNAANDFAKRMGLSLPTESQWEFACRAGTNSPFSTGVTLEAHSANIADQGSKDFYTSGWRFEEDYVDEYPVHAPVGSMTPNAFGLFDMHGNVFEWCQDWYGPYALDNIDEGTGLRHPLQRKTRVRRGGSFFDVAVYARSANRYRYSPEYRFDHLGFRVTAALP
ncbi:MAG: formylglycine-generating enzyme required for sulfatase activity/serine/threonine protein kinase [Planctomycetota bacterium]|jgi:formylglycine-generating enzyme required for sulfatase activity/serine/threonine protein kinase